MATLETQAVVFAREDTLISPVAYIAVPQVVNIGEVGSERSLIDVTNLASTLREYAVAIPDGAEIDIDLQYGGIADLVQGALKTDLDNGTVRNFRVTLTDSPATTWTFAGLVTSFKIGVPIDSVVPLTVRIKITDSPVIA